MKARKIACLNKIDPEGLSKFSDAYSITKEVEEADGWLVRSADLLQAELPQRLRAIARAGAGVNNIPVSRCSDQGVVVFNTPGANANAVAELVVASLVMSCRNILGGACWLKGLGEPEDIAAQAEKGKGAFQGTELRGKKIGVIGLGAIGYRVANAAIGLGMEVYGFDPMITPQYAWQLSSQVRHVARLDALLDAMDFITLHVPLTDQTRGMIGENELAKMKDQAILLNFARGELVNESALGQALEAGKLRCYATDFASPALVKFPRTLVLPHLGASTQESEGNCADMAVKQIQDYLDCGNIENSVNYPAVNLGRLSCPTRVVVLHRNVPAIISRVTTLFGEAGFNIEQMVSASRGNYACALFDVSQDMSNDFVMQLKSVTDILKIRVIKK